MKRLSLLKRHRKPKLKAYVPKSKRKPKRKVKLPKVKILAPLAKVLSWFDGINPLFVMLSFATIMLIMFGLFTPVKEPINIVDVNVGNIIYEWNSRENALRVMTVGFMYLFLWSSACMCHNKKSQGPIRGVR